MNASAANLTPVGGLKYINRDLGLYVPYISSICIGIVLGVSGNLLVIATILKSKKLRDNPTFILILNMALADLSVTVFYMPFIIVGALVGKGFFDAKPCWCQFAGSMAVISSGATLVSMNLLAVNRYLFVFHSNLYKKIFVMKKVIGMCFSAWIMGLAVNAFNYIPGVSEINFDVKDLTCAYDRTKKAFVASFCVFGMLTPIINMGLCYTRIFIHSFSSKQKTANARGNAKFKADSFHLALCLFASYVLYCVCLLPAIVKLLIDLDDLMSTQLQAGLFALAYLHASFNPIVYGTINPKIREGYKELIEFLSCGVFYSSLIESNSTVNSKSNNPSIPMRNTRSKN